MDHQERAPFRRVLQLSSHFHGHKANVRLKPAVELDLLHQLCGPEAVWVSSGLSRNQGRAGGVKVLLQEITEARHGEVERQLDEAALVKVRLADGRIAKDEKWPNAKRGCHTFRCFLAPSVDLKPSVRASIFMLQNKATRSENQNPRAVLRAVHSERLDFKCLQSKQNCDFC